MPNVTVKLVSPIQGHVSDPTTGESKIGHIDQVVLREPRYRDIMTLGEPAVYARSDGGMVYQAEKDDVVQAYIERLLIEPKDRALLEQVSLADALQLKEAVFGFFSGSEKGYFGTIVDAMVFDHKLITMNEAEGLDLTSIEYWWERFCVRSNAKARKIRMTR